MTGKTIGKISIYYRDLPKELCSYLSTDEYMSWSKDGLKDGLGHKCPRLSVFVFSYKTHLDGLRVKKLLAKIDELVKTGKVIDYNSVINIKLPK